MGNTSSNNRRIYHERQYFLKYCGLHCLNNLFQERNAFTRAGLNVIGRRVTLQKEELELELELSFSTPPPPSLYCLCSKEYNVFTGKYSEDVLSSALEGKGKIMVEHNFREPTNSIDLDDETLMGIVVQFSEGNGSRHWSAVKKIDGVWYDLDSYHRAPRVFINEDQVKEFLTDIIDRRGRVYLVRNDIQVQS